MLGKGINHYSAGWSTQVTHWAPFVDLSIVPSMKGESGPYTNIFTHFVSVGGGWRHNCSLISRSHDPLGNSSILRNPCTMACTWASGQFHGSVGPAQLNHESLKKSLKASFMFRGQGLWDESETTGPCPSEWCIRQALHRASILGACHVLTGTAVNKMNAIFQMIDENWELKSYFSKYLRTQHSLGLLGNSESKECLQLLFTTNLFTHKQ